MNTDCVTVLEWILTEATNEQLTKVWSAAKERQKSLDNRAAMLNSAYLGVGQRVRTVRLAKYLCGREGTVSQILPKRGNKIWVKIDLDTPIYQGKHWGDKTLTVESVALERI